MNTSTANDSLDRRPSLLLYVNHAPFSGPPPYQRPRPNSRSGAYVSGRTHRVTRRTVAIGPSHRHRWAGLFLVRKLSRDARMDGLLVTARATRWVPTFPSPTSCMSACSPQRSSVHAQVFGNPDDDVTHVVQSSGAPFVPSPRTQSAPSASSRHGWQPTASQPEGGSPQADGEP